MKTPNIAKLLNVAARTWFRSAEEAIGSVLAKAFS